MKAKRLLHCVLAVAVLVSCCMMTATQGHASQQMAYFMRGDFTEVLFRDQQLGSVEVVEPKGEFAKIDVMATNAALRRLMASDLTVRKNAVEEVTSNPERYAPTALYVAAYVMFDLGAKEEAPFWFYLGQVRAGSDEAKCGDVSAGQAKAVLTEQFGPPINLHAYKDWKKLKATVEKVIAWDRDHARKYDPRWVALHGMEAFTETKVAFEPEARWAEINERWRTEYLEEFQTMMKQMEQADKDGNGQLSDSEKAAFWREMQQLEALESYEKTESAVSYEGRVIGGADVATFQLLDDPLYAKDKAHIYVRGHVIAGADPDTFTVIDGPYSKDKARVYCGTVPMEVRDVAAFEVVYWEGMWQEVADKKHFVFDFGEHFQNLEVSEAKPAMVGLAWARDGSNYYYGPARVEGGDYDSFTVVNGFEAKDKNREYNGAFPTESLLQRRREILGMRADRAVSLEAAAVHMQGLEARDEGKLDQAIAHFSQAIQIDPDYAVAYSARGDCWKEQGQYDKAVFDYTEAIRLEPDRETPYFNRALALAELGEYDRAITDYGEVIRIDAENHNAYINRGIDWTSKGNTREAIADFSHVIELMPDYAKAYRLRGKALATEEDYDGAIADYSEAIRLEPDNHSAYRHRGLARQEMDRHDEAIADYTKAIELKPDYAEAFCNRGFAWKIKQDYNQAITDLTEAIRLVPRYRSAYLDRASAWYNKGEYDKSIADYDEAIRLNPKDHAAHFNRALNWNAKGQFARAVADYTQAIELKPSDLRSHLNRGLVWNRLGDLDNAIADFTKAIEIDPRSATAYENRAEAWKKKGMPEKALLDYDQLIGLDAANAQRYINRGFVRQASGQYVLAMADYAKAIELDVDYALAHNNLAWLMATCPDAKFRDGQRALVEARKACELTNWENASYHDTLAAAYAESGDFERAVQSMELAIELGSGKYLTGFHERLALYQTGKPFRMLPADNPTNANSP